MLSHPITRKRSHPKTGVAQLEVIARGLTRKVINTHIGRIKRLFRWAVEEEMLPVTVHQALLTVSWLKAGSLHRTREDHASVQYLKRISRRYCRNLHPMMAAIIQIHRALRMSIAGHSVLARH